MHNIANNKKNISWVIGGFSNLEIVGINSYGFMFVYSKSYFNQYVTDPFQKLQCPQIMKA